MKECRVKMNENGRFLIPASYRKLLHFVPGEELVLRISNGELCVSSLKQSLNNAQSLVQRYAQNQSLLDQLKIIRDEDK